MNGLWGRFGWQDIFKLMFGEEFGMICSITCWNDSHLAGNKAVINSNEAVGGNMLKPRYKHNSFTHCYEA